MAPITRRDVLRYGAGVGAASVLPLSAWPSSASAQPSVGNRLAKFVQPLPLPGSGIVVAQPSAPNTYSFTQREIMRQLHPALPSTPVWAFDDGSGLAGQAGSFGMVVVAQTGTPLQVSYTNGLPPTYPAWTPVDTRLTPHGNQVRALTHLHGAFVSGASDGNPAATPDGYGNGETQMATYPNEQPATQLWFHDHSLGSTRLGVFAGLAGGYLLRDEFDTGTEPNPIGIPGGAYEIPLVIQDRQFNSDGTFRYPVSAIQGVTWIGEYFGDTFLVNGKVWPFLNVEPRLYRFRVLNGSNARILSLRFPAQAPVWQIGAEGGMWDVPIRMQDLVLAPAERADVIVDFRRMAGQTFTLLNHKPAAPVATPAPPLRQVMQFRVGTTVSTPGPSTIPATLPGRAANLPSPAQTRFITLNEILPGTAGWVLNINGAPFGPPSTSTENPRVGTVEDWVYINLTADTHPIHPHLVTHQVVGRTPFDVAAYQAAYGGPNGVPGGIDPTPFATGPMLPPTPDERGFKDTVKANPGEFVQIRARFDLPNGVSAPQAYSHHCHIVEHEDNDMMRPFTVTA